MWKKPYTFREGFMIDAGLFLVGLMLQLSIGPLNWDIFMWPANIITLLLLIALSIAVYVLREKSYFLRFITTPQAAVPAVVCVVCLTLIMGLTRQASPTATVKDPIGISRMLCFWPFILTYLWMTAIVAQEATRQIMHPKRKQWATTLSHIGLFIVLTCGTLGSADMQRLKMYCEQGKPEWRALDAWNNVHHLPVALQLEKFTIDEYPPKLMVIDANGIPLPAKQPETLLIDSTFKSGSLQGWIISVKKRIDNAFPSALAKMGNSMPVEMMRHLRLDSLGLTLNKDGYLSTGMPGSQCALLVEATKGKTKREGWVTCGSYQFTYQGLQLDKSHNIVMGRREPKRYASLVDVYTEDGKNLQTTIEVNHPLTINGWKIYQLSYNEEMGKWSTLSVFELVKDPWLPAVYIGILLLALGAIGMLGTRRVIPNNN